MTNIVTYTVGVHGNKESAYEAARIAGFTDAELSRDGRFDELKYVGYEVLIDVTVDRDTGKVTEKVRTA